MEGEGCNVCGAPTVSDYGIGAGAQIHNNSLARGRVPCANVMIGVEDDVDDEFVYLYVMVVELGGRFPLEGNVYNKHD